MSYQYIHNSPGQTPYMGIFGMATHEKIAKYLYRESGFQTYPQKDLERIVKDVLRVYQFGIQQGLIPRYEINTPESGATIRYVTDQTGYSQMDVSMILLAIQEMAMSGQINLVQYNPLPEQKRKEQKQEDRQTAAATFEDPFTKFLQKNINFVIVTGAIVGTVYLLGKEFIKSR